MHQVPSSIPATALQFLLKQGQNDVIFPVLTHSPKNAERSANIIVTLGDGRWLAVENDAGDWLVGLQMCVNYIQHRALAKNQKVFLVFTACWERTAAFSIAPA